MWFQKMSILPPQKGLEIWQGGGGGEGLNSKAKNFNIWNIIFQRGEGVLGSYG